MGMFKRHGLLWTVVFLARACTVQADSVGLLANVAYEEQAACTGGKVAAPSLVTATPYSNCIPSKTCTSPTGSWLPYYIAVCSATNGSASGDFIKTTLPGLFGAAPYVVVEKYTHPGCTTAGDLSDITVYLADGLCHTTSASAAFRATRAADGSATIMSYADNYCSSSSVVLVDASAAQSTALCSIDRDHDGTNDSNIYGAGVTTWYLKTTVNFDTNTTNCAATQAVPTLEVMDVGVSDCSGAVTTGVCTGIGDPFSSTACSTLSSYKADVAAAFGSTPYLIVEEYVSGKSCDGTKLSGITVYLMDGLMWHKLNSSFSYSSFSATDGSTVLMICDGLCPKTNALDVSAAQAKAQSCIADANGLVDRKIYGAGVTPVQMMWKVSFDTETGNCTYPVVPIQMTTDYVLWAVSFSCTPTSNCSGLSVPYESIHDLKCNTLSTYQADVAAAFGSMPYVILEGYTPGKSCDGTSLTGITVYLADGLCHKPSEMSSYIATRAVNGSTTILAFTTADCTRTSTTLLDASAAEVTGQSCANDGKGVLDTKIYGFGVTPLYLQSTLSFDTNVGNCSSSVVPTQEVLTLVSSTSCTPTNSCSGSSVPFTSIRCSAFSTYQEDVATAFGSKPYVILEEYVSGMSCDASNLSNVTVYLADGVCHKTGAIASYIATRAADGSATIETFDAGHCTGSAVALDVTAEQANNQSCAADKDGVIDMKVYGSGETLSRNCPFDVNLTTCSEVYETCGYNSSCNDADDKLSYYCSDLGCNGTWASSSGSGWGTNDVCQSLSSTTCEEAHTALVSAGCTCSYCSTKESYIAVGCYSPFTCSSDIYTTNDVENKYTVAISVYLVVAGAFVVGAIVASQCCTSTQSQEMTTKDIVRTRLSCLGSGIYRMSLASFVLDDGSPLQFLDYAFDKRDLFGFLDCRNKTVNMRPRWMRLGTCVTTLLVTISLAFIYGIYAYNKDGCSYYQQSCTVVDITVSCGSSGDVVIQASWTTALLTLVVSKGSALVVNTASVGSMRQKLNLTFTFIVAVGLLIFGVELSNRLSKAEFEGHHDNAWLGYVGLTLLEGWGFAEFAGIALVILRFLMCRICYNLIFWPQLKEVKKSAGAAAVHPQKGNNAAADVTMKSGGKSVTITVVSPADSDNKTMDSGGLGETTESPTSASITNTNKTMDNDENTEPSANPATVSVDNSTDHTRKPIGSGPESNGTRAITSGVSSANSANKSIDSRVGGENLITGQADLTPHSLGTMSIRGDRMKLSVGSMKLEPPKRGEQK